MKKSQRNARRESIWSSRPELQDLQESRSCRLWAGRKANCQSKKAWKNSGLINALAV